MCKQTPGPHKHPIPSYSDTVTQATCRLQSKSSSAQQKTQSLRNNWPYMQMRDKMEYALLPSINLWPHVSFVGKGGEEVLQGGENKSIASGKATRCYLKYAICPDIRLTQEARCDLWKVTSIVLFRRVRQSWGLPGTKFPCTTSLYAHHPSWIFGGLGCAVGWWKRSTG